MVFAICLVEIVPWLLLIGKESEIKTNTKYLQPCEGIKIWYKNIMF